MRLLWACLFSLPLFAADVAIAPQSLTFAYQWRSAALPLPQGIVLTSPQPFAFTASRPASDPWLAIPISAGQTFAGTGPVFFPVNVQPGVLGPGTYRSAITLRFDEGVITIPVTFVVGVTPVLAASPAIVGFDPSTTLLTLQLYMSSGQLFISRPSTTTDWLTFRGTSDNLFLGVDPAVAGLALRAGSLEVAVDTLPRPSPISVPMIYLGTGFSSPGPLKMSPAALGFTGSGTRQVAVTGGPFTATADAAWVTTAVSGQTLSVTANTAGLAAASHQATVVLNSGGVLQMLPVGLNLGPPSLVKVVNAASWVEGSIAPGEVMVLGGANLGPGVLTGLALDESGFVSPTLAGVQVTFNGVAAPLVYVSATLVAAVAPYELDGRTNAAVQVTVSGRTSNTLTVPVAAAAPGIFTANASGTGPAAAFRTGDVVSIFLTGEGQTNPGGITGKVTGTPPVPRLDVAATIDGQTAEVLFAGEAPGVVSGVMQVNLRAAAGVRSGPVPVVVTVGGVPSQPGVTVSVR
jgi:uncharacterized protein (TIGR03437 family)